MNSPPPSTLSLSDIYYVLFRHKWKIAIISALGLVAALVLPLFWPRPYQSEAKLYIKYVQENRAPFANAANAANDTRIKSPDDRGDNIINSELEILTSLDVAHIVVSNLGPERILARLGGGADYNAAAAVVHLNLLPDVPKKSNVIRILFQHPDPALVQPVLGQVVAAYLDRHAQIHRGVFDDFLNKETDELHNQLKNTEELLHQAKTNADVISLEDSKKAISEQLAKIRQAVYDAQADLAKRQTAVAALSQLLNPKSPTPAEDGGRKTDEEKAESRKLKAEMADGAPKTEPDSLLTTHDSRSNSAAALNSQPSTLNLPAATNSELEVPSPVLAEYTRLRTALEGLQKQESDLLTQFTPESPRVKVVQQQIADKETRKKQLEDENPGLLATKTQTPELKAAAPEPAAGPRINFFAMAAEVAALQAELRERTNQLARIEAQARALGEKEGAIADLQTRKDLEESRYRHFSSSLEQSKIDDALDAGHISNISIIQLPSPPFRDSTKLHKVMAMLFFGGIAAALALAFLTELYLDRSLKRPIEVEARLGLPLFLSIPFASHNGKPLVLKPVPQVPLLPEKAESRKPKAEIEDGAPNLEPSEPALAAPNSSIPTFQHSSSPTLHPSTTPSDSAQSPIVNRQSQIENPAPWDGNHVLHPFWDALRDRLITYFELKNLTHKPKLVALTSVAEGSGVTTIAAGLAAALSETGDGNVLLVDMNQQAGAAHQFYRGNLAYGLDDALTLGKREQTQVQDNLYVVSESTNGDKLPRILPRRFTNLVPRLKASDYDYIIFDMPPVSQISVTPRLARFMDVVLMVVESEKTDRDVVKRASAMLAENRANVGVVMNKSKTYVPKRLHQEL